MEQQAVFHIVRIENHAFSKGNHLNKDGEFAAMFVYKLQNGYSKLKNQGWITM